MRSARLTVQVSTKLNRSHVICGETALILPVLGRSEKDTTGSREERRLLMEQAWTVFLQNPITGIGAGQFQNYGAPGQAKKWRVTHNAYLQVAAELGIFGILLFLFIVWRGFSAAWWTRQHLNWIFRRQSRRKPQPEPEDGLTASPSELRWPKV